MKRKHEKKSILKNNVSLWYHNMSSHTSCCLCNIILLINTLTKPSRNRKFALLFYPSDNYLKIFKLGELNPETANYKHKK